MENLGNLLLLFFEKQVIFAPILMLIIEEAGFPIPVADLVITYMGYQVSKGHIGFIQAYIVLIIADLLGASFLYFLSYRYGRAVVNKLRGFIHLDLDKIEKVESKFKKYGPIFIIVGRHIIGMRVPVTVASGMSKVPYPVFLLSTFISIILWIPFYLSLGIKLGPKTIQLFHKHITTSFIFLFVLLLIYIAPFIYFRAKEIKDKRK